MENIVIAEALKRGAEVFPNACCTGDTDLIIKINGRVLECDVKSMTQRHLAVGNETYYHESINKVPKPIQFVSVHPIEHTIAWHPRRIPEGLETFWDKPSTHV